MRSAVALVRGWNLEPFVGFLHHKGVPTREWMTEARLSPSSAYRPDALVTLRGAYRFLDLAAREPHLRRLPVLVAARTSAFDLGSLGQSLRRARTVGEYLRVGSRLIPTSSNSGAEVWLSRDGDALRVNQRFVRAPGSGPAIVDAYTLILTLNMLRSALGSQWGPVSVDLRNGTECFLGEADVGSCRKINIGAAFTSFTLPVSDLARPMPGGGAVVVPADSDGSRGRELPGDFLSAVAELICEGLPDGRSDIRELAETLHTSPRSLQRRFHEHQASFRDVVATCRLRLAKEWLTMTEKSVADIAVELGYSDASNFARAFRRAVGKSPSAWRDSSETDQPNR